MKNKILLTSVLGLLATSLLTGCNNEESHPSRVVTKFLNYDESVLYVNTIPYGSDAVYQGEIPKRESSDSTVYTFSTWDKPLESIIEDTTFYAQYTTSTRKYEINFVNYDGTVLETQNIDYGMMPVYSGMTPTREADAQYTYSFSGWSPAIDAVKHNQTYTAQFSTNINEYTVTWLIDGIATSETYQYGEVPSYKAGVPSKSADAQYSYTFKEWSPEIKKVTGDVTYTAIFDSTTNSYTITWVVNGNTTTEVYEYGAVPSFKGSTDKPQDAQYSYSFTGWSPTVKMVTSDAIYTAQYEEELRSYTITWDVDGVKTTETYKYGDTPVFKGSLEKDSDEDYDYTFSNWEPSISTVTGDTTYSAVYSKEKNLTSIFDLVLMNEEYSIVGVKANLNEYVIPDTYKNKPITSIGDYVFHNTSAQKIIIGNNVTKIGNNSVSYNSYLKELSVPDSLESYGENSLFANGIGSSPHDFETAYGNAYFIGNDNNPYLVYVSCDSNASLIRIPETCKFINSVWLTTISMTNEFEVSVNNPYFATYNGALFNKDFTKMIRYPANKTGDTFAIPSYVTELAVDCFGSSSLKTIDLSYLNLVDIPRSCFSFCTKATSISLPTSVKNIGESAFYACYQLESLIIPDGVENIGDSAFATSNKLSSLSLPDTIKHIGMNSFYNCTALPRTIYQNGVYAECSGNPYFALIGTDGENQETYHYTVFTVHDDCRVISPSGINFSIDDGEEVQWFIIGKELRAISQDFLNGLNLYNINKFAVQKENDRFTAMNDGQTLYRDNNKELLKVVSGWNGVVLDGTRTILEFALYPSSVSELTIPSSVIKIENQAGSPNWLSKIYYAGTMKEWSEIEIGRSAERSMDVQIICSDGTITTRQLF